MPYVINFELTQYKIVLPLVPKALVPRNTMKVRYREITWLSGESF